jgi:pimeloyl-ACP methyl ester carboxylesterase
MSNPTQRNNARVIGSGPTTFLLAHGFGTDQTAWRAQATALAAHCRVVLFDHVAAGGSDLAAYSPRRYQSLHSYSTDLLELVDELDVTDATLVGHSINADRPELAQEFAANLQAIRPDIALGVAKVIFESDHREELEKLDLPTLVLQSQSDVAVPVEVGGYLARHIRGAKLEMLDATGHFPHWSAPEKVTQAILSFAN